MEIFNHVSQRLAMLTISGVVYYNSMFLKIIESTILNRHNSMGHEQYFTIVFLVEFHLCYKRLTNFIKNKTEIPLKSNKITDFNNDA